MSRNTNRTVKAAETLFKVIEALEELDGASVSELAQNLEVAKSTAHRHLSTLEQAEYVVKEGDQYQLGLRFLSVGEHVRNRIEVYQMVQPLVDELAEKTEERGLFTVEEHGRAVKVYRAKGRHAVETDSLVGTRRYLHTVASGKAILANLPEHRVDAILQRHGLPASTDQTITDRETLFEELERIRDRGVAFNREESIPGLRAVAAPVVGNNGQVCGALTVSGPASRMKSDSFEQEIPDLLLGMANELKLNIAHSI